MNIYMLRKFAAAFKVALSLLLVKNKWEFWGRNSKNSGIKMGLFWGQTIISEIQ